MSAALVPSPRLQSERIAQQERRVIEAAESWPSARERSASTLHGWTVNLAFEARRLKDLRDECCRDRGGTGTVTRFSTHTTEDGSLTRHVAVVSPCSCDEGRIRWE